MNPFRHKNFGIRFEALKGAKPIIRLSLLFSIAIIVLYIHPTASAQGISTAGDYANRLGRAETAVAGMVDQNISASAFVARIGAIKRLAPANEDVEFNGSVIHVDNSWLHEAVDNVIKNASGDVEQRRSMLIEISDRLGRLKKSVEEAQTAQDPKLRDQQARLDNILARSEYLAEEKRESFIAQIIRKIKESIYRLFIKLFGATSAPKASSGLLTVFRALVILALVIALVFGIIRFTRGMKRRERLQKEPGTREALGEEIADDVTAADLFAEASELARKGEYRKAIRRAYIALLCELELRGKLQLGRSKTNRDYLEAIRSEHLIFPKFSVMTNAFEHVWYGQERATEDEFQDFVTLYEDLVK